MIAAVLSIHRFSNDDDLHCHACTDRRVFVTPESKQSYADARLRGRLLDRAIFDRMTAADIKRIRWADIGKQVRHIAGAKK